MMISEFFHKKGYEKRFLSGKMKLETISYVLNKKHNELNKVYKNIKDKVKIWS